MNKKKATAAQQHKISACLIELITFSYLSLGRWRKKKKSNPVAVTNVQFGEYKR